MTAQDRQQLQQICKDIFKVETEITIPDAIENNSFGVSVRPNWNLFGAGIVMEQIELRFPDEFSKGKKVFGLTTEVQWETRIMAEFMVIVEDGHPKSMSFNFRLAELSSDDALKRVGTLFQASQDAWEIPDFFPKIGVTFKEFRGTFSFSSGLVDFQTVVVAAFGEGGAGWSPLSTFGLESELFSLQSLSIALKWAKGFKTSWRIGGMLDIEEAYRLDLRHTYPLNKVSAQLIPLMGAQEKLDVLFKKLELPAQVTNIATEILSKSTLTLNADLKHKEFKFEFANYQDPWMILETVEVSNMELKIFWFRQKLAIAELFLEMELPIGKLPEGSDTREQVTIEIDASYNRIDNYWSFSGETGMGQEIAVGDAIAALLKKFKRDKDSPYEAELPGAIQSLKVRNIRLSFDSLGAADLICETAMEVDGHEVSLWVHLKREKKAFMLAGSLFLNNIQLAVAFSSQGIDKTILASLLVPIRMDTKDLIQAIAPNLAGDVPLNVAVHLKGLLLGMHVGEDPNKKPPPPIAATRKEYIFRLSFDLIFDLSRFPLIGSMLSEIKFADAQLLAANKDWKNKSVKTVNELLHIIQPTSPKPLAQPQQSNATTGIGRGISLSGTFQLTEKVGFPLFLNFAKKTPAKKADNKALDGPKGTTSSGANGSSASTTSSSASQTQQAAGSQQQDQVSKPDQRAQSKVNKVISAVRIKKVSLIFEKGRLGLKLTGGLALATFEFELMGLQVTVPQKVLSDPTNPDLLKKIEFGLDGFGVSIQKGTLSILGAFMRKHYKATAAHDPYDEYIGAVQVAFPPFSLAGIGAYAKYEGVNSLFLFVSLGFPIPVHPSLLIQGMCLGFGIHRDFISPKMDEILTYPLVQMSVTPPPQIEIDQLVTDVHRFFPPKIGQYFIVAGVKFKAFGILNNLVMLAVKFGRSFEINLIGVSNVFYPSAFIELGWKARFVPSEGYLFVGGQLTSRSYLLIPQVQLTGGFAVAAWLDGDRKGDFVATVGGYHPKYHVPAHYPNHVPRLGISFHLDPITIKGGVYFAVTPQCIMMGGLLEASVKKGPLSGFMKIHMDALINFEPFHYDIVMGVDIGVKVEIDAWLTTIHINKHFHIDVHIWGPDFSGTASVDVGPKTFEIEFGDAHSKRALPIGWGKFQQKFLNVKEEGDFKTGPVSITVTEGLIRKVKFQGKDDEQAVDYHIIDPKRVVIEAKSLIPLDAGRADMGIAPMGIQSISKSVLTLEGQEEFHEPKQILDKVPQAIWGSQGLSKPSISGGNDGLLKDVPTGYRLIPKSDSSTSQTQGIDKENFTYNTDEFPLLDPIATLKMKGDKKTVQFAKSKYAFTSFTGLEGKDLAVVDDKQLLTAEMLECELK